MMQRCVRVFRQSLADASGYSVFWIVAGCAGLSLNSPGYAQEAREPAAAAGEKPGTEADDRPVPRTSIDLSRVFEQLDRDSSGTITLDEVPESLRDRLRPLFERLGTDTITREDLARLNTSRREVTRSVPAVRGPAIFSVLDENGDGRISRQELSRAAEKFDELDADGNGAITAEELFAMPGGDVGPRDAGPRDAAPRTSQPRPRTSPEGAAAAADEAAGNGANGAAGEPAQPPAASVNRDLGARLFQRYDQDGDGRLSRDEAPAALRENFERFDADGDGQVTREEFSAVVAAVRESGDEDERQLNGESAAEPSPVAGAEPRRAAD